MGYSLTYSYGEFEMNHATDDDTTEAMKDGSYVTAHKLLMAQAVAFIDSGVLDDEDADGEAAELVAMSTVTEVADVEEDDEG